MEANTPIKLHLLNDSHIEKIISTYRSIGLDWDQKVPTADDVIDDLEYSHRVEYEPTVNDERFVITIRSGNIHAYITGKNGASEIFDQKLKTLFR